MKRILILSALLAVNIIVMAQDITLKATDRPAAEVFRDIMLQTDMNFIYSSDLLKDMRVSVNVRKQTLKKVLKDIFKDSDINFQIKGKNVILKRQERTHSPERKQPVTNATPLTAPIDSIKVTMLDPVEVVSQSETHPLQTAKLGINSLDGATITRAPAILGEPDLIKAMQILPGVSEATAGTAGMHVHGGESDQNLFLLDMVPLYEAQHVAGLFSPFNTDIVKEANLYKTSIPARYDGRLSSVLDVRLKNGGRDGHHGSARLGLTSGAFNISGPIGEKTSYLFGIRRSWYDIFIIPAMAIANSKNKDEKGSIGLNFMDINARVDHRFSDKASGFVNFYFGDDYLSTGWKSKQRDPYGYYESDKYVFSWGNIMAQAGMNLHLTPSLEGEVSAAFSRFHSTMKYDIYDSRLTDVPSESYEDREIMKNTNSLMDLSLRGDFSWRPHNEMTVRFGTNYMRHYFLPDRIFRSNTYNNSTISSKTDPKQTGADEAHVYVEDDWRITDRFHAEGGVNASIFRIDGNLKGGISPRAAISFSPGSSLSFKGAYTRTVQYLRKTEQTYVSLPIDRWIPATGNLKPMTTDKISLGGYWQTESGDYSVSAEGYWKFMHNLIDFRDEYYLIPQEGGWIDRLTVGKGSAKGIDIMLEKKTGSLTGHVAYSLAWADRTYADRNFGHPYPARFAHRHTIKVFLNWDINKKVSLSAFWTGHSGNRFTFLPQRYESPYFDPSDNWYNSPGVPLRMPINNYQLPFYHRLDLSINVKNRGGKGYWTFGLYNAYCNMNTVAIVTDYTNGEYIFKPVEDGLWMGEYLPGKPVFRKLKLIPVIPSFSYTWLF